MFCHAVYRKQSTFFSLNVAAKVKCSDCKTCDESLKDHGLAIKDAVGGVGLFFSFALVSSLLYQFSNACQKKTHDCHCLA